MTKYVRSILVSATVLLGLTAVSCSDLFEQRTSSVSITLPRTISASGDSASGSRAADSSTATDTPADLQYIIILTPQAAAQQSDASSSTAQTKTAAAGSTVTFDNIDAGTYTVSGTAYNSGEIYAQGSQTVDITAGEQATVNLTLTHSLSAAEPSITAQPESLSLTLADGSVTGTLSVTASSTDGGTLSYQWYSYTAASATDGTAISGATESSYTFTAKEAGTTYYYVIVTNTNTSVTGTQTATATSNVASVLIHAAAATLTSFDSAALTNSSSYVLVGNTPALSLFTVTETYSDGTKQTKALTDSDTASYSVSTDYASDIGSVPVTITNTSLKTTQTITVPYKYEMPAYAVTTPPYAIYDAQYTGTSSFTAEFGAVKTYSVYTSGSEGDLSAGDTVSYQWYSNTTNTTTGGTEISGATLTTYTPPVTAAGTTYYYCAATYKPSSDYCTTSVSTTVTTNAVSAEVVAWTLSLTDTTAGSFISAVSINNGDTYSLTAEHPYSISFTNTADTDSKGSAIANSSSVTWTSSNSAITLATGSGNWTFTAPASTSSEQSITLTAKYGTITFGVVTFTVPKTTTTVTSLSDLKTAIEAVTDTTTNTTVSISGTFNMSKTSTTPSTITVAGNVTVIAGSDGCTITRDSSSTSFPLFTVSNGATLILGGSSSGALTIDGGAILDTSYNNTGISANAPLIQSSGALEISTNCTLQNNYYTSNGGAISVDGSELSSSSTIASFTMSGGEIKGNYAYNGGAVYIVGKDNSSNTSLFVTVSITGGTIDGNTVSTTNSNGGGLYLKYVNATMTGGTISGNKAISSSNANTNGGGGLFLSGYKSSSNYGSTFTMTGGSISSNTSTYYGGGIYVNGGTFSCTSDCTLTDNSATTGDGAIAYLASTSCSFIYDSTTYTGAKAIETLSTTGTSDNTGDL